MPGPLVVLQPTHYWSDLTMKSTEYPKGREPPVLAANRRGVAPGRPIDEGETDVLAVLSVAFLLLAIPFHLVPLAGVFGLPLCLIASALGAVSLARQRKNPRLRGEWLAWVGLILGAFPIIALASALAASELLRWLLSPPHR